MSDKRVEEREFVRAVGLDASDLEWLVKDAPEVPADVAERVRRRVHANVAAPVPAPVAVLPSAPNRLRTWSVARFAAAAALVVALGGTVLVSTNASARELFQDMVRFIPGLGLKATDHQTQLLSQPIPVTTDEGGGAITAVVAATDRTHVRVELDVRSIAGPTEGTYWGLVPHRRTEFPADLVLPDGNRLLTHAIKYRVDEGKLMATFEFEALPAQVERMRLEVASFQGSTLNLAADISLVPAAAVTLPVAVPVTPPPAQVHGVEVGVAHYMLDGDLIRASVTVKPATSEAKLAHGLQNEPSWLELTDNLGNRYELVPQSSDRLKEFDTTFNLVFQGPLKEGATELTFTVPKVYMQEEGQFYYEQSVADWPVGEVRQLDQV